MPAPRKVDRPVKKQLCLPESLVTQVDLALWSELEGRTPKGEWSGLVAGLLRDWLKAGQRVVGEGV